jgi:RHS repeat-associated protein
VVQERISRFFYLSAGWARRWPLWLVLIWLGWLPAAHASRTPARELSPDQLACLTSPGQTRVGVCGAMTSGRLFSEDFLKLEIATAYGACDYETVSGRRQWLNRDPIGIKGGINLYSFAGNSPAVNVDRYGLLLYGGPSAYTRWQCIQNCNSQFLSDMHVCVVTEALLIISSAGLTLINPAFGVAAGEFVVDWAVACTAAALTRQTLCQTSCMLAGAAPFPIGPYNQ